MRNKTSLTLGWILPVISWSFPLASLAITPGPSGTLPPSPITTTADLTGVVCGVAGVMFILLIVTAIAFGIYAAFLYLTAGGEEEKIKTANHTLIYVFVAIAVALVARGLPAIVSTFLGSSFSATCP